MTNDILDAAMGHLRAPSINSSDAIDPDYDGGLVAHTASRLLSSLKGGSQGLWRIPELLRFTRRALGVPLDSMVADIENPVASEIDSVITYLAAWKLRVTPTQLRLAHLCDILGLDHADLAILIAFAYYSRVQHFRALMIGYADDANDSLPLHSVVQISGVSVDEVSERLAKQSRLVSFGLISWDDRRDDYQRGSLLREVVSLKGTRRDVVEKFIVPDDEGVDLHWDDFSHLGHFRSLAEKIFLSGEPASILFYGEVGAGKSEFARTLARRVGRGATFAGLLGKGEGEEPKRDQRLGHLAILRRLCADRGDRIIVVDEADDILSLSRDERASKQFVNRLVEDPKVPTIWIVNDLDNLDIASVRRMTLAIRFERPSKLVRQRIALRLLETQGLTMRPEDVHRLANFSANVAVIATGVRAAHLSGGGIAEAKIAMASVLEAMKQRHRPDSQAKTPFDPSFASADTDLSELANRLATAPSRSWSLLLSGPSGTGKSAFARHLAECLGIEVLTKRASDLISSFVGDTEANIARAFAEAARHGAMLLIDEADSFLYRRDGSQRSWETSQVNEMLCQMERLQSPFVATTNLAENLDPAAQRRFTMRVAFRPMTARQAKALFTDRFGIAWPDSERQPVDQTPGDFAVVAARAHLLGEQDPVQLACWLREEVEARDGRMCGPVGFEMATTLR